MFERYTESARRAVFSARAEASQSVCKHIESHHLLLGILREQAGLLPWLDAGVIEEIRADCVKRFPPRLNAQVPGDLPLSHETKRALAYAAEEAELLHDQHIDCGHLLLGLLREERSEAAATLRRHGVDLSALRNHTIGFVGRFSLEDLYALVEQIPPERADATARILEALRSDAVKVTVIRPNESFEISFGGEK
jgi:ATP-dependent Clp protease ATP-binding subunit ClpA